MRLTEVSDRLATGQGLTSAPFLLSLRYMDTLLHIVIELVAVLVVIYLFASNARDFREDGNETGTETNNNNTL